MKFIRTLLSILSFLFFPHAIHASGYQTWYLAAENGKGESPEDFLGNTTLPELRELLADAGVELHIIQKPTVALQETHNRVPPIVPTIEVLWEEHGMAVGIPSHAAIPHHIRIETSTPLEEFSISQAEKLQGLIRRVSAIMQETLGHSHFVLAKGRDWIDFIPSQNANAVDFADRCKRLIRLYDPSLAGDQPDRESVSNHWKQALARPTAEVDYPPVSHILEVVNGHEALSFTLEILAQGLRGEGFFLLIEELGGSPPIPDSVSASLDQMCAFCSNSVIERQSAYEGDLARVLYNHSSPIEGGAFMVIPKRHCPRVEGLTAEEMAEMLRLEQMVVAILEQHFGEGYVVAYTQNSMPAGQTVGHSHTKIQYRTPVTFGLASLRYIVRKFKMVSPEEMARVTVWLREAMAEEKAA